MTRLIGAQSGGSEFPAKRPECPIVPEGVRTRDTLPDALLKPPLALSTRGGECTREYTLVYTWVHCCIHTCTLDPSR